MTVAKLAFYQICWVCSGLDKMLIVLDTQFSTLIYYEWDLNILIL